MEQLHLVGFTTDHKGLILGARKDSTSGSYVVMIDDPFIDEIEELLRLRTDKNARRGGKRDAPTSDGRPLLSRPRPESRLTPREVQALLRTGKTITEVAETAGVAEDWVARFAPPVMAEQAQVIERTSRMTYNKPRLGPSTQPLAESVAWNLADRGVELPAEGFVDGWTAFQQGAGRWVVRVTYPARGKDHHADWVVSLSDSTLTAVSRRASELGYVEPGRKRPAGLPAVTVTTASPARAASPGGPVRTPPAPAPPPAAPAAPPPPRAPSFARTISSPTARGLLTSPEFARRPMPPRRPVGLDPPAAPGATTKPDTPSRPGAVTQPAGSTTAPAPTSPSRPPARSQPRQAAGRTTAPAEARPAEARPAEARPAEARPASTGTAAEEPAVRIIRRTPRPTSDGRHGEGDKGRVGKLLRPSGDRSAARSGENPSRLRAAAGSRAGDPRSSTNQPTSAAGRPERPGPRSGDRPGLADRAARANAERAALRERDATVAPGVRPAPSAAGTVAEPTAPVAQGRAGAGGRDAEAAVRPSPGAGQPTPGGAAGDPRRPARPARPTGQRPTRPGPGRAGSASSAGAPGATADRPAGRPPSEPAPAAARPVNGKPASPAARPTPAPVLSSTTAKARPVSPEQRQWVTRLRPPAAAPGTAPAQAAAAGNDRLGGPTAEPSATPGAGAAAVDAPDLEPRHAPLKPASGVFDGDDDAFAPMRSNGEKRPGEPDTAPVPVIPADWDELMVDVGTPLDGVVIKTGQASGNEDEAGGDEWRYPPAANPRARSGGKPVARGGAKTAKAGTKSGARSGAKPAAKPGPGSADTNGRKPRLRLRRRPPAAN